MDFYDINLAKALGGGGGGGSSDFTTIDITIINEKDNYVGVMGATILDVEGFGSFTMGETSVEPSITKTHTIVMYKGQALINFSEGTISASGAVQALDARVFVISGECSFTIS